MKYIPLYTTSGDLGAFLVDEYIYDPIGDWIGFTTPDMRVYSVWGRCVGWLSKDQRILCNRTINYDSPKITPPAPPARIVPPSTIPLPLMTAELKYEVMDLLEERPDLLPTRDAFAFDQE